MVSSAFCLEPYSGPCYKEGKPRENTEDSELRRQKSEFKKSEVPEICRTEL